jgi:hypothetical protein
VLFDIFNFKVVRPEKAPGKGGEADVGAQYVHVMQQAWQLTGDDKYLKEAENAAQRLEGIGFELGYQYNNTSFGAAALMWLWKKTGNDLYRKLSAVCLASMVQNLWLWECEYGYGRHYHTFMGMPPLRNAPYLALYEELEILAAFHEYFNVAGKDAVTESRVLLPEYCKFLLSRAWYNDPSEIPRDILADKCKSGCVERNLSIPLEDLYDGWTKAGQVGQQVYGAAAPFVFATRHFHQVPGNGFIIACDYPLREMQVQGKALGRASFQLEGDHRCRCHVRITAENFDPLPEVRLFVGTGRKLTKGRLTKFGYLEYEVPGDARIRLEWKRPAKPVSQSKPRNNGKVHQRNGASKDGRCSRTFHSARPNHQRRSKRYENSTNGS